MFGKEILYKSLLTWISLLYSNNYFKLVEYFAHWNFVAFAEHIQIDAKHYDHSGPDIAEKEEKKNDYFQVNSSKLLWSQFPPKIGLDSLKISQISNLLNTEWFTEEYKRQHDRNCFACCSHRSGNCSAKAAN